MQAAETVRQLRSQLIEILNVPQGYASGFDSPAALLDELFEQPAGGSQRWGCSESVPADGG